MAGLRWKALIVAGDGSIGAFDRAADRMEDTLQRRGVPAAAIQRFSATPDVIARPGVRSATRDRILAGVEAMKPGPGEGCMLFATSHGVARSGLFLSPLREALDPAALDAALAAGCGNAPTVVIVSSCYSGLFAQSPMTRANRVILTAARADRVSFGCGARNEMTDYDTCLLGELAAPTWQAVHAAVLPCVRDRERRGRFAPSSPQGFFGEAVGGLPLPGAPPGA